jgi:hypothetical protein
MYSNTDYSQQKYYNHIQSANNNDLSNLIIISDLQQKIFFATLSITLNITIQVNYIAPSFHITTTINTCLSNNLIKIVNIRSFVSHTTIYEPWINSTVLNTKQKIHIDSILIMYK